jgi:SAM-dependent methyltransferase
MSHKQQRDFCTAVKANRPSHFTNVTVLDCGSLDINGSNRYLFDGGFYLGLDVGHGKNVDIVCPMHEFDGRPEMFDTVISTECFEHDLYWKQSVWNIIRMLKPGGMFIFTCAAPGRKEHGTLRSEPDAAPLLTARGPLWASYYQNLDKEAFGEIFAINEIFSEYEWGGDDEVKDLYFWGIKRNDVHVNSIYLKGG